MTETASPTASGSTSAFPCRPRGRRRYKPLFAVLCVDLDGRLNVNAHGNPTDSYPHRPGHVAVAAGTTAGFPKGRGYGPPEIALSGVTGSLSGLFGLRYGSDGVPGGTGLDPLAGIKFFEEPQNFFASAGGRSAYSSPPDLRGELAFGLDVFGQPAFEQVPGAVAESRADSPYEINLLDRTASDAPFSPAELEPILRPWTMMSVRYRADCADNLDLVAPGNARLVTTDSYDPRFPGFRSPRITQPLCVCEPLERPECGRRCWRPACPCPPSMSRQN